MSYHGPISLANIVHNERIFPEYIQHEVSGHNLAQALLDWLDHPDKLEQLATKLARTRALLMGNERSSAEIMLETIRGCYE